ncbi:MAG: 2-dehydropantoate 2-reductase [Thermoplasmata archaeon]
MKVVILGAGAVGSLFAARLAQAGHAVTLVGRPDHVAQIRASGLRVLDHGVELVPLVAVTELPDETVTEAAFVTTKTFDLAAAAATLARAVRSPVPTLLPQNGLGVEAIANDALASAGWSDPSRWTVRAVHSVPVTWVGPGVVRQAGTGEILLPETTGPTAFCVRRFEQLFSGAGFTVRTVRAFDREVWRKVLINAAINTVTAVRGVPNGRLLEEPARGEALALLREALTVARAAGHEFSEEEAVRDFEHVARATAENRSSMLQDMDRGRPTEVDSISGALLRIAVAHGLDLPATRAVTEELRRRARESARRA